MKPIQKVTSMKPIRRWLALAASLALLGGSAWNANAVLIKGEIHFGGDFTPTDGTSAVALGAATHLEFPLAYVSGASDDFSSLFPGPATINGFQFNPTLDPSPVAPLWTAGSFSFNLESILVVLHSDTQLNLSGAGTLSGTGYDNTPGTWSFQGGTSLQNSFSFVANTTAVPDSGATFLMLALGLGLVLVGFAPARKFARA